MEDLATLTSLKSLWLGKNKIEVISNVSNLSMLKQLDIQNNRLSSLAGLSGLVSLEELYLACNSIKTLDGISELVGYATYDDTVAAKCTNTGNTNLFNPKLNTLDLSTNGISTLKGIDLIPSVTELWMSSSALSTFTDLEILKTLPELSCLYLEHSPISSDFEYRKRITVMLPSLTQLDAKSVK